MNTRLALLATILMVASGCDKAKEFVRAGQAASPPVVSPGEELDLAAHPEIIFQVFGESNDPRMIPIAAVTGGRLRPIVLSPDGWRQFDAMYLRRGKEYSVFQDGRAVGSVNVRQGMWERDGQPLYTLPGCHTLTPLAAVQVRDAHVRTDFTVELLASTTTLGQSRAGPPLPAGEVARTAKSLAAEIAQNVGIRPRLLDSLDFHATAFMSGVSKSPTIVAAFIDPGAENATSATAQTAHILLIADLDSTGAYRTTFAHRVNGPLATAAFRRFLDHLDLTGDGTDEIILEGWPFGGETFLQVLSWDGGKGKWVEAYRTRANWCLDVRASE